MKGGRWLLPSLCDSVIRALVPKHYCIFDLPRKIVKKYRLQRAAEILIQWAKIEIQKWSGF